MKFNAIVGTMFALAVAHDIRTQIKSRSMTRLYFEVIDDYDRTQVNNEEQIKYLCHILDQHGVPFDEFDMIALTYHQ